VRQRRRLRHRAEEAARGQRGPAARGDVRSPPGEPQLQGARPRRPPEAVAPAVLRHAVGKKAAMIARIGFAAAWLACAACAGKLPETRYYQLAVPDAKARGGDDLLVLEPLTTDAA